MSASASSATGALLLVEDNDDHAELLCDLLQDSDRGSVQRAKSLAQALERIREGNPRVVLLDLGLPDSKGLPTLAAVAQQFPGVPLVVLTANSNRSDGIEAIRSGAQDYLVKGAVTSEMLDRALRYAVERKQLWLELEQRNRDVEAFAAMASHDLQGPLRRIRQVTTELVEVLGAGMSDEWLSMLQGLGRDATALDLLVRDMLRFTRLGRGALEIGPIDLGRAVEAALGGLDDAMARGDITVHYDGLPQVRADRRMLEALLKNLLENGAKYVRGRTPELWVSVDELPREHVVRIRDNGIGIAAEHLERIFEPLVRVAPPGEFRGSGLGLATCRRVVEAHGGRIWVESVPDQGSTFCFTLPK
ncbi:MAG: response regulator [Planctomycetes bacterium]|nr:response regulator [Planctomycetota bacterium]